MNFVKESKSTRFFLFIFFFFGGGGGERDALEPKKYARLSNEVKYKMKLSTQCRACGTINISKYVNNFLSTNPSTLILSSLVSEI